MNRTLALFLAAAAVVGATGGTVAATTLVGNDDDSPRTDDMAASSSSTPSAQASTTPTSGGGEQPEGHAGPVAPGETGEVFWATQRVLHDGDHEIRIQLVDEPASLERAVDSWVITTRSSPQEPAFEVSVVRPDGTVTPLADTFGDGGVSPDGTRYVAMKDDGSGYGVWDIATGEEVDTVEAGLEPDQYPFGGAQFVGDDAVASTWNSDDGDPVVLLRRLGSAPDDPDYDESDEITVVSKDVVGQWAISPDGRWFAGVSRTAKDAETGFAECASIAPVVGPADSPAKARTDCGSTFAGVPSFKDDSSAVLALPYDTDGFGPGVLRPLATSGTSQPAPIDLPEASLDGVYLRDDLVAVLGAKNLDGDGLEINVCSSTGCEGLSRFDDPARTGVLGTTS